MVVSEDGNALGVVRFKKRDIMGVDFFDKERQSRHEDVLKKIGVTITYDDSPSDRPLINPDEYRMWELTVTFLKKPVTLVIELENGDTNTPQFVFTLSDLYAQLDDDTLYNILYYLLTVLMFGAETSSERDFKESLLKLGTIKSRPLTWRV